MPAVEQDSQQSSNLSLQEVDLPVHFLSFYLKPAEVAAAAMNPTGSAYTETLTWIDVSSSRQTYLKVGSFLGCVETLVIALDRTGRHDELVSDLKSLVRDFLWILNATDHFNFKSPRTELVGSAAAVFANSGEIPESVLQHWEKHARLHSTYFEQTLNPLRKKDSVWFDHYCKPLLELLAERP